MKRGCQDRERIFLDGSAEEWAALEQHALDCAECGEEMRSWGALSTAAEELREYGESPALWSRIEASLAEQAAVSTQRAKWRDWLSFWRPVPVVWQTAVVAALLLTTTVSGVYLYMHRQTPVVAQDKLLQNSALGEVERAEQNYANAIGKLESETKPRLANGESPLMASYREKLVVLDSAIDELRVQAGENPSNAHLRHQLLAMYQEKQETLEEVLETKQ